MRTVISERLWKMAKIKTRRGTTLMVTYGTRLTKLNRDHNSREINLSLIVVITIG